MRVEVLVLGTAIDPGTRLVQIAYVMKTFIVAAVCCRYAYSLIIR